MLTLVTDSQGSVLLYPEAGASWPQVTLLITQRTSTIRAKDVTPG